MKKKNIVIVIVLLLAFLIGIIFFMSVNKKKFSYKESITINVGDIVPSIKDYVNDEIKTEITWNNINIEDNKIYYSGTYTGTFKYKNEDKKVTLNVVDNEKPTINGVKDIEIYVNDNIDLLKNIEVKDNSHDKTNIEVIGDYDKSKKGEYNLKYVASDANNNKAEADFKLSVNEKKVDKPTEINNNPTNKKNKESNNKKNNVTNNVVGKTTKGYEIKKINGVYYINGILIANKTYSLSSTYAPGGLLSDISNAISNMKKDAKKEGISFNIISGYRSYATQKSLYNNYVARDGKKEADTYSARPGHSEHQTGLAADLNSLYKSFGETKEGIWLANNCYKYGLIIRYPKGKENITGYMYEPWHVRYVGKSVAKDLYNNGNWLTLEEYLGITSVY